MTSFLKEEYLRGIEHVITFKKITKITSRRAAENAEKFFIIEKWQNHLISMVFSTWIWSYYIFLLAK